MKQAVNPKPDERVCFNCEYMLWMVALGQGVRCRHPANNPADGKLFRIPSRRHTCEHFEGKLELVEPDVIVFERIDFHP